MRRLGRPTIAVAVVAGLMLLAAALLAVLLTHKPAPSPSAADGRRLTLEMGRADARADVSKPIRCFVDGRNVGDLTIPACARRNGVDARALDMGLDRSGVLSAGQDVALTPAPVALDGPRSRPPDLADLHVDPSAACLDYGSGGWRAVGSAAPLDACVRRLFEGRCEQPGGALYGRWSDRTLRLVPGRVEISADNRTFQTLLVQTPGCSLPPAR